MQTTKNPRPKSARCLARELSPSPLSATTAILALLIGCTATAAVAQSPATAEATSDSASWIIGERTVSAPAGASDDVRGAIAATPPPNVEQRRRMASMGNDQWLAMQKASSPAGFDQVAEQYQVAIERREIGGVSVYSVEPVNSATEHKGRLFLHFHGGGYVFGGGDAAVTEAAVISGGIGMEAVSVDYRMPPEHPFPAAIEDAVAVYRELTKSRPASSIFIGGTSAGGGLALAVVHRIRSLKLDLPGAIWAGTPWADLTKTGDTLFTNEGLDRVLVSYDGLLASMAKLYANGHDLKDPLLSPVYGDFEGFPPTQFVTGTRDLFLSDTARTHRKLRAAGVVTDLNVYEGLSHAEYLMVPGSPESHQVISDLNTFLLQQLP